MATVGTTTQIPLSFPHGDPGGFLLSVRRPDGSRVDFTQDNPERTRHADGSWSMSVEVTQAGAWSWSCSFGYGDGVDHAPLSGSFTATH